MHPIVLTYIPAFEICYFPRSYQKCWNMQCLAMSMKVRRKYLAQSLYLHPNQKLTGSILCWVSSSIKACRKSFSSFCAILQTKQQTDTHGWKHNLLGRGNKQMSNKWKKKKERAAEKISNSWQLTTCCMKWCECWIVGFWKVTEIGTCRTPRFQNQRGVRAGGFQSYSTIRHSVLPRCTAVYCCLNLSRSVIIWN